MLKNATNTYEWLVNYNDDDDGIKVECWGLIETWADAKNPFQSKCKGNENFKAILFIHAFTGCCWGNLKWIEKYHFRFNEPKCKILRIFIDERELSGFQSHHLNIYVY